MKVCIRELAEITDGILCLSSLPPLGGDMEPVGTIRTASHLVQPGDTYWDFPSPSESSSCVEEAFARGAMVVVTTRQLEPWPGRCVIEVEDAHLALTLLAKSARSHYEGRVIAVLGDESGEMVAPTLDGILANHFRSLVAPSSNSGQGCLVDLALQLVALEPEHEFCVINLKSEEIEQFDPISHLCCPHIAVITCLAKAVTNEPATARAVVKEYNQFVASLPDDGLVVVNGDDPLLRQGLNLRDHRVVWYGSQSDNDVAPVSQKDTLKGCGFHVANVPFFLPASGSMSLSTALACIAVGREFQLDWPTLVNELGKSRSNLSDSINGLVPAESITLFESGSVTDVATLQLRMRELKRVSQSSQPVSRRVVICGELPGHCGQDDVHQELGQAVSAIAEADVLVVCGKLASNLIPMAAWSAGMPINGTHVIYEESELQAVLREEIEDGDCVLVAPVVGWRVLETIREVFSDRLRHAA